MHHTMVAAAPLHAVAVDQYGLHAAACIVALVVVFTSLAAGALMTVPAVVGLKLGKIQIKRVATLQDVLRDLPLILFNAGLSFVLGFANLLFNTSEDILRDITVGLPSPHTLAAQTAFSLLMTEVWFYHVHRLLHENKRLYGMIHKKHHTWTAPVAIVSTFAHPVEHIGVNLLSVGVGPYLCGAHPLTALAYGLVFAIGACGHHSGYWSDDLGMHDLHHEAFNVNYGNAHILDFLYGTYRLKDSEGAAAKDQ